MYYKYKTTQNRKQEEKIMTTLREKYGKTFEAIKADAVANVHEASENLQERMAETAECKEALAELKETAKTSKKGFFEVIKILGKLAVMRKPNPEEVRNAIAPCITYADAAGQVPTAEAELEEAKTAQAQASQELAVAEEELRSISYFA